MGIRGLNKLIERKSPRSIAKLPWLTFKGHNIAIDFDVLLRKHFSIQYEILLGELNPFLESPSDEDVIKNVSRSIIAHLESFYVRNKITPIIVLSGETPQEKKDHAHVTRAKERQSKEKRYKEHLRQYTLKNPKDYDNINPKIFMQHTKLKAAAANLPRNLLKDVVEILQEKGFSILRATFEAEELCAALCLEAKVQAVYSTDTENIVRRCPALITNIAKDQDDELVATITRYSDDLLEDLDITYKRFVEVCILAGCDYNFPTRGISAITAHKLIVKHGNLRQVRLNELKYDYSNINSRKCKEIFNLNHKRSSAECCANPDILVMILD
jgi:5'-3' exonuclease